MAASLKIRAILAVGGLLAGLAGAGALVWAAIAALTPWLGIAGAAALIGALFAGGAGIAIWLAFNPAIPLEDEFADVTEAAQDALGSARDDALDALAELPVKAMNRILAEQPVVALLGVAMAAYTVTRSPAASAGILNRVISRLI